MTPQVLSLLAALAEKEAAKALVALARRNPKKRLRPLLGRMTLQQRRLFEALLCTAEDGLKTIPLSPQADSATLPHDASPRAVFMRMKAVMPLLELHVRGASGKRVWAAVVSIGAGGARWQHGVKFADEAIAYRLPEPAAMSAVNQIAEAFLRTRLKLRKGPPKPTREVAKGLRAWPATLLAPEPPPTNSPAAMLHVQRLASNPTELRRIWVALAKSLDAEPPESWTLERAENLERAPEIVAAWLVGDFVPVLTMGDSFVRRSTLTDNLRRASGELRAPRGPAHAVPVETLIVIRCALNAFSVAMYGHEEGVPPIALDIGHVEDGPAVRFVRAVLAAVRAPDAQRLGAEGIRRVARDMHAEADALHYALARQKRRKTKRKRGSN